MIFFSMLSISLSIKLKITICFDHLFIDKYKHLYMLLYYDEKIQMIASKKLFVSWLLRERERLECPKRLCDTHINDQRD